MNEVGMVILEKGVLGYLVQVKLLRIVLITSFLRGYVKLTIPGQAMLYIRKDCYYCHDCTSAKMSFKSRTVPFTTGID